MPAWQTQTGPNGYTKTTLDGLGRAIKVERGPNSGTIQSETDTVYAPCACSPLAKLQKTSQPYVPGGTPVWTTYTYDGIGRTLTLQQPDGASTTTYSYLGNLTTVLEPDPASGTGGTLTTSYAYDWMNHLATSTMTRGSTTQTRTFVYNDAGLLTSATNPENGTVTYTYNADNTLARKVDAVGNATAYTYDSLKRIATVSTDNGYKVATYWYDTNPLDPTFSSNTTGRLAAVQYGFLWGATSPGDPMGDSYTEMYSYHAAGGVTAKRFQITRTEYDPDSGAWVPGSANLDVGYTYDTVGRQTSISIPGGASSMSPTSPAPITYTTGFDSMGRLNSLTDNNP